MRISIYHFRIGLLISVLMWGLAGIIFFACSSETEEMTLGNNFIESNTHVQIVDTFSVELSTILSYSMPSSGMGVALVGVYEDTLFGKIVCNSFFKLGIPDEIDYENNDNYESIELILNYNGYRFGDTTKNTGISVRKIVEDLELDEDGYLYSNTETGYEDNELGFISITPSSNDTTLITDDSVTISLNNDFGEQLFDLISNKDSIVYYKSRFQNFLKGIALIADENYEGVISGFNAKDAQIVLRLKSSRSGIERETIINDFPLTDTSYQFNQINYDFTGTDLEKINKSSKLFSSSILNDHAYIQAGLGLITKITFPSMQDITLFKKGKIIQADLILCPQKNSYKTIPLTSDLVLYKSDKYNNFNELLYDTYGTLITPSLIIDEMYNEETSYTFDITDYLNDELSDSFYSDDDGLMLTYSSDYNYSSLYRVLFNTKTQKPKLKIYYLTY